MLWLHALHADRRHLLERYGPWRTVASQFSRWVHAGDWDALLPSKHSPLLQ
jgi:hypothetical protein